MRHACNCWAGGWGAWQPQPSGIQQLLLRAGSTAVVLWGQGEGIAGGKADCKAGVTGGMLALLKAVPLCGWRSG